MKNNMLVSGNPKEPGFHAVTCTIVSAKQFEEFAELGNTYICGIDIILQDEESGYHFRAKLTAEELSEVVGIESVPSSMELIRIAKWLEDDPNPVQIGLRNKNSTELFPTAEEEDLGEEPYDDENDDENDDEDLLLRSDEAASLTIHDEKLEKTAQGMSSLAVDDDPVLNKFNFQPIKKRKKAGE